MKTKMNPILEELWQSKDGLAREAGDDVARIRDQCGKHEVAFFFKQWGGPEQEGGGP